MTNPNDIPEIKETGDVRAKRIAKVYAEALFEAANKAGQLDAVTEELEALVREVLLTDPRFDVLFASPAIGRYVRADILAKAFKERLSPTLYAFLQVLNGHDRLELLASVTLALRAFAEERGRRVRVYVTSAVPLGPEERIQIVEGIKQAMKLEPILVTSVDPSILGGVKIRVGDKQFDATVRSRIENIRNQILTSSSHEIQSRRDRFSSADGNRAVQG
jgi:F-type H+-transporting ATPase subunit delta